MFICDNFSDHQDEFLFFEAIFGGRVDSVFECGLFPELFDFTLLKLYIFRVELRVEDEPVSTARNALI